jgi:hypothetical protein
VDGCAVYKSPLMRWRVVGWALLLVGLWGPEVALGSSTKPRWLDGRAMPWSHLLAWLLLQHHDVVRVPSPWQQRGLPAAATESHTLVALMISMTQHFMRSGLLCLMQVIAV